MAKVSGGLTKFWDGVRGICETLKKMWGTRKDDKYCSRLHCTLTADCCISFCWITNSRSDVVTRVTETTSYFNFTQVTVNYNTDVNSDTPVVGHLFFFFWNSCLEATVYCLLHKKNNSYCFLSVGSEHKNWLKNGEIVIILFASVDRKK